MSSPLHLFPVGTRIIYDKILWTFLGLEAAGRYACLGTSRQETRKHNRSSYDICTFETNVAQRDREHLIPEASKFDICYWVNKTVLVSLAIAIPGQKCSICQSNIEHQIDKICVFCAIQKSIEA